MPATTASTGTAVSSKSSRADVESHVMGVLGVVGASVEAASSDSLRASRLNDVQIPILVSAALPEGVSR